jgi:glutaredoxin-like protein DUF836
MTPRVVVYSAPGCHLCGPAVEAVRNVCGDDFAVVDITTDPELERRYRTRIPVVTVDGVERFWFEVTEEDLREVV